MQDAAGHHLSSNTHIAATDGNILSPIIPGTLYGVSPAGYGDMNREHRGRRPKPITDQISVAARRRNPSDRNPHPDRMVRSQNQNGKTSVPRARDTHGQNRRSDHPDPGRCPCAPPHPRRTALHIHLSRRSCSPAAPARRHQAIRTVQYDRTERSGEHQTRRARSRMLSRSQTPTRNGVRHKSMPGSARFYDDDRRTGSSESGVVPHSRAATPPEAQAAVRSCRISEP
jgi:hypothetical protein